MENKKYWVALNQFSKFGPLRFKKLLKYFQTAEQIFNAPINEFKNAGIEESIAQEFISMRTKINPDQLWDNLEKENIKIVTINEDAYPKLLKEIHNPPALLYYKGKLEHDEYTLAVVGTRKCTSYGQQIVNDIVKKLISSNLTIVSGLALGIDTLAHSATLEARGRTISILGTGLDKQSIYPVTNKYLADKIVSEGGCIFSEFPLGTPPLKHHFPQRNRIISGLSLGTLVIEAGERSGALITAFLALEQNREVFSVPGNIYSPVSAGPNKLIKLGAKTITSAEELIESLNLTQATEYIKTKEIVGETETEKKIIPHLDHEPKHVDELIRLTKLDTSTINSTLTIMEMKGMVKNLGGMQYVLAR